MNVKIGAGQAGLGGYPALGQINSLAQQQASIYQQMMTQMQNVAIAPHREPIPKESLSRTTLVAVEPTRAANAEHRSLASRAAKVLGYKHFSSVIDQKEHAEKCAWEAARAFEKLGFDPLDTKKVLDYKQANCLLGYAWVNTPIEKYAAPIPEFALSRAIELKQELADAQFQVEHLEALPDPFLVMIYGNSRYYIDVWDEPKFEGRRTV